MTEAEVKKLLISCLPPGSGEAGGYAIGETQNIGKMLSALAGVMKTYGTDIIDRLPDEFCPLTCTEKIPDWEAALGLTETPVAKFGTVIQRRNAIISQLRQSGTFSLSDIRACVQPYLLYDNPANIVILETSRADLNAAHTYTNSTGFSGSNTTTRQEVAILDSGEVSRGGVTLTVDISGILNQVYFLLFVGPRGWPFSRNDFGKEDYTGILTLHADYSPADNRAPLGDTAYLTIGIGPDPVTINSWSVTVEGEGPQLPAGEGLAGAMFEFVVAAHPGLLGAGYDIEGANRALQRIKPAHVRGSVTIASGRIGAGYAAIPDNVLSAIPDRGIPG